MRGDIQFARIDVKQMSRLKRTVLVFFGFLLLSILSFAAVLSVRAYFTSTDTATGTINFGTVEVQLLNSSNATISASDFQSTYLSDVMPGSTLNFNNIRVKNSSDTSIYALVNVDVTFTATGATTLHYNKWYNTNGEEVKHLDFAANATKASFIGMNSYLTTNIKFKVPDEAVGNQFKNGKMKVTITAYGTQSYLQESQAYVSSELYASYFICKNASQIATDNSTTYTGDAAVGEPLRQVVGKNLFDINNYVYDTQYGVLSFDVSNLEIGQQYVLSSNKAITWFKISVNKDGYASVQKSGSFTSFAFTMAKHANISHGAKQCISMSVGGNLVTDISQLDGYQIQIEKGTTATTYEAFSPIRDTFDIDTQTLTRNVGKIEFTGSESGWYLYNYGGEGISFNFQGLGSGTNTKVEGYQTSWCSHFKNTNGAWGSVFINSHGIYSDHSTNKYLYFRAPKSSITTLEQWQAWLTEQYEQGTPVTVWYQLATPTTEKVITSKNLYDGPQNLKNETGASGNTISSAGTFTITKTADRLNSSSYQELGKDVFNYIFNKPLTISCKVKVHEDDTRGSGRLTLKYEKSDGGAIAVMNTTIGGMTADGEWHYYTVSLPAISSYANASSVSKVRIWMADYSTLPGKAHVEITDIQIEVGSAPTDFENYDQTEYQRVNNVVLRKVGTAQDTYDASTKTITRNVSKTILDDTITYYVKVNDNTSYITVYTNDGNLSAIAPVPVSNNRQKTIICSHLPYRYSEVGYTKREDEGIMGWGDSTASFIATFKASTVGTTEASFKAWMNKQADLGTPLTIWYEVATPFEEYLD